MRRSLAASLARGEVSSPPPAEVVVDGGSGTCLTLRLPSSSGDAIPLAASIQLVRAVLLRLVVSAELLVVRLHRLARHVVRAPDVRWSRQRARRRRHLNVVPGVNDVPPRQLLQKLPKIVLQLMTANMLLQFAPDPPLSQHDEYLRK